MNSDDQSDPKKISKDNLEITLDTVQNPYYGSEIEIKTPESSIGDEVQRNCLKENIKVTQNPYYE